MFTLYKITNLSCNETLQSLHNLESLNPDHIQSVLDNIILITPGWNTKDHIEATPIEQGKFIYHYNGNTISVIPTVSIIDTEVVSIAYSFVIISKDHNSVALGTKKLYGYESASVDNFHLLTDEEKIFIFHSVIIANQWPKHDCIMAIPADISESMFCYCDGKISIR